MADPITVSLDIWSILTIIAGAAVLGFGSELGRDVYDFRFKKKVQNLNLTIDKLKGGKKSDPKTEYEKDEASKAS